MVLIAGLAAYFLIFWNFKRKFAEISQRLDGQRGGRGDPGASPGHAYALASRGPKHARDAEWESAKARWNHLSLAFPHLDDRGDEHRPLIVVSRDYTEVDKVNLMQSTVESTIDAQALDGNREVKRPAFIQEEGKDFDALRHPQLAIANPAIYTFPFFLTWQRRHQWGVLPYGVHNRLGVICSKHHPEFGHLKEIEKHYASALAKAKAERGAFWVNDPSHADWLRLLLQGVVPDHREFPDLMRGSDQPRVLSAGAYLHKELLPLTSAVLPDPSVGAMYAERAREIEVSTLKSQLEGGMTDWPKGSAIIVDLAVLTKDLEAELKPYEVLRLAHCVYVPIGIGYSVTAVPFLLEGGDWRNDMLRSAGNHLRPAAAALADIGIELDDRLWLAR